MAEKGLVTLYLYEREDNDSPSPSERYLDITMRLSPRTDHFAGKERGHVTLSKTEIEELAGFCKSIVRGRLFSKFGIADLKSSPGYPKGPNYWIDDEVYEAILRPDLKAIKS